MSLQVSLLVLMVSPVLSHRELCRLQTAGRAGKHCTLPVVGGQFFFKLKFGLILNAQYEIHVNVKGMKLSDACK